MEPVSVTGNLTIALYLRLRMPRCSPLQTSTYLRMPGDHVIAVKLHVADMVNTLIKGSASVCVIHVLAPILGSNTQDPVDVSVP